MSRSGRWAVLVGVASGLLAGSAFGVELSVWAHQDDIQSAAGETSLVSPAAIAFNPKLGKLAIFAGDAILEWERGATTGVELVDGAAWIGSPFAAAYIPNRNSYLVASGGDEDAIVEVQPNTTGQTPSIYVPANPPYFPAGGLVSDGQYAYYKSQWTGIEQPVKRFNLSGAPVTEEVYVPKAAFDVYGLAGPSQQLAMDSTNTLYLAGRPFGGGDDAARGIYRFDEGAGQLTPVLTFAEITAFTGESNLRIYGLTFDETDALYFFDIYSYSILRWDRFGNLSTFLTGDEIRDFMGDPSMQVNPSFMTVVNDELVFLTGNVSGHILAAKVPIAEPYLATVPNTDYEPNGPTYTYKLGKYEITNAEYCMFLNDAHLAQQSDPTDPRCSNMFFSTSPYANGDVFMTDPTVYDQYPSPEWYDRTLYHTSDIPDSKIHYNPTNAPGSWYYVQPGMEHHPVGTVSWYGAAKFCNWLTVRNGMDPNQRCYTEGTDKYSWVPVTAGDWFNQGLLPSERLALVRSYRGYRLPMDGVNVDYTGPGLAHSWNISANPYNEWYKAAAWDPAAPDMQRNGPGDYEVVEPDHWTFGFGADVYTAADENTQLSNNGFFETTPVGWYDGVNQLDDGTPTNDTRNRYGLYDMMGNVCEWITDTSLVYPWDPTYRAARGGKWTSSDVRWNGNTYRLLMTARYYAENSVGFRLLRSAGFGDFDGDDSADMADVNFFLPTLTGPDGAIPVGLGYEACDADGDEDVDLADVGALQGAVRD